jgi:hypothetical protein
MCSLAALSTSAQRDMLLALADNIERVMEADKMTRATLRREPGAGDRVLLGAGGGGGGGGGGRRTAIWLATRAATRACWRSATSVDVLNDGGATRRRLGGDRHAPAASDTGEAKQLYARLIALQRKGRRTKGGSDANRPGGSGAGGRRRWRARERRRPERLWRAGGLGERAAQPAAAGVYGAVQDTTR